MMCISVVLCIVFFRFCVLWWSSSIKVCVLFIWLRFWEWFLLLCIVCCRGWCKKVWLSRISRISCIGWVWIFFVWWFRLVWWMICVLLFGWFCCGWMLVWVIWCCCWCVLVLMWCVWIVWKVNIWFEFLWVMWVGGLNLVWVRVCWWFLCICLMLSRRKCCVIICCVFGIIVFMMRFICVLRLGRYVSVVIVLRWMGCLKVWWVLWCLCLIVMVMLLLCFLLVCLLIVWALNVCLLFMICCCVKWIVWLCRLICLIWCCVVWCNWWLWVIFIVLFDLVVVWVYVLGWVGIVGWVFVWWFVLVVGLLVFCSVEGDCVWVCWCYVWLRLSC